MTEMWSALLAVIVLFTFIAAIGAWYIRYARKREYEARVENRIVDNLEKTIVRQKIVMQNQARDEQRWKEKIAALETQLDIKLSVENKSLAVREALVRANVDPEFIRLALTSDEIATVMNQSIGFASYDTSSTSRLSELADVKAQYMGLKIVVI